MAQPQQQKNLREVYELLDKLCKNFCPTNHKDVLKKITNGIIESQYGFLSNSHVDETILLAKIKNQLSSKSSHSNLAIFLKLHEELSTLTEPKFRSSILTFLLCMSDMEKKLPNTIEQRDFSSSSVISGFTLPARSTNYSIQQSASMEQIFRNAASSKVSFIKSPVINTDRIK
jgi:hypothetical protein